MSRNRSTWYTSLRFCIRSFVIGLEKNTLIQLLSCLTMPLSTWMTNIRPTWNRKGSLYWSLRLTRLRRIVLSRSSSNSRQTYLSETWEKETSNISCARPSWKFNNQIRNRKLINIIYAYFLVTIFQIMIFQSHFYLFYFYFVLSCQNFHYKQ